MSGKVICSIPLDASNVRCRRHWWALARKMSCRVGCCSVQTLRIGNNISVMQEDPKDFFSYADYLVTPGTKRSRVVDRGDEAWWLCFIWL